MSVTQHERETAAQAACKIINALMQFDYEVALTGLQIAQQILTDAYNRAKENTE